MESELKKALVAVLGGEELKSCYISLTLVFSLWTNLVVCRNIGVLWY